MSTQPYEPERFQSPEYLGVLDATPSESQLTIVPDCLSAMRSAAEAGYPLEVCGLLVGKITHAGWQVQQIHPVDNVNSERAADRFQLDPAGYQRVDRELRGTGMEIIGVYHSHPDCPAKPSPTDLT
ncbi:MAG: M67 family metallopeptidase, partial [Mariprofundus sp.]